MLTDPRIRDEDYLFWDNDPFAPPPGNLDYVKDVNTGLSYTETYRSLIKNPEKQILLPVIFYIDGANTGQFVDLPITAVKISLGIFSRKARNKFHFWETLGYIPAYTGNTSKGKRNLRNANHLESRIMGQNIDSDDGVVANNKLPKAQDLHTILDKIFEEYIKIQNTGFIWDLFYNGKLYKDVEFVLFTPFMKLDSDEAEKLCGKYTSRGLNTAGLCRYCECPSDETDNPLANYPMKTPAKIQRLVDRNRREDLKNMAQQYIQNACYKLRFGTHNNQGVHGACPMEMLHQLLLGMFKYIEQVFMTQIGSTSDLAAEIDGRCQVLGAILSRQSDRNFPKTTFPNGIMKGKLMAQEHPGVILVLACALKSTEIRDKLKRKRKALFAGTGLMEDWQTLFETLLQWERWLNSEEMPKYLVIRAFQKHKYVMYLIKKISK